MHGGGQHGAEKLVEPQIAIVAQVADVGIDGNKGQIGLGGHRRHGCHGAFEHVVFRTPLDYAADVETMDQQGVPGIPGMRRGIVVPDPLEGGQGVHAPGQEDPRVAFFFLMQGRLAKRCIDGQRLKRATGPVMHEDHDRLQSLFEPGTEGIVESQAPLPEIKGRDNTAHGKGVGVGKDRLRECRFGFDEDFLRRLMAVLEGHRGHGPDQSIVFSHMQVGKFHFRRSRFLDFSDTVRR